ncbi:hypothetical protein, partial [Limnospira sp. PMC 1252.20]|uniref:hypothetical protein n=1 Tax=Limnospira sp. PMC 1252.20 TaxID=2981050 RepID=UPI0028E10F0D
VCSSDINYTGVSSLGLLLSGNTLNVGEVKSILLVVDILSAGTYENTATGTGTSPGGTIVSDDSQEGTDSDPSGDGNPGDEK